jgi:hypothetical protein
MDSFYTTQRPSLLALACAPSGVKSPIMAATQAPLPQVHQVQIQAELVRTVAVDSGNGITGFAGGVSVKGAAGGVPPRGRPV